MKTIVVTRPLGQGQDFASRLTDRIVGLDAHNIILEPLLKIEHKKVRIDSVEQYVGIIVTSSNALLAGEKNEVLLNKPFYCVGNQTAEKLKTIGVGNIITAPTAADLMKEIYPHKGKCFFYMRGKDISFDVKEHLHRKAIVVDEVVSYEACTVDQFSQSFVKALADKKIDAVTFFSKRTAEVFVRLLRRHNKEHQKNPVDVTKIHHLCISQPVLEYLHTVFDEEKVIVSKTPDMQGMIGSLEHYFFNN